MREEALLYRRARGNNSHYLVPGSIVQLADGRIGIVDLIAPSPLIGPDGKPEPIDRAYVVGLRQEFADWVVVNHLVHIFKVVTKTIPIHS